MVISFPVVPLEGWNPKVAEYPAPGTGMCAFHVDLLARVTGPNWPIPGGTARA